MTEPIRVLVIDDHRMFTEALELLLTADSSIEVVGAVGTAEEALGVAERSPPHVALMDIDLPGIDGIEATRRMKAVSPQTQVVMITAFQQRDVIARAIEAGASGYVPKTQAADSLVDVIYRAASGEMVLPTGVIGPVLETLQRTQRARSEAEFLLAQLTSREVQILQGIAEGKSTTELANTLYISPSTVQTHVKNVLAKLGVHSKLEAITFAIRHGLIRIG